MAYFGASNNKFDDLHPTTLQNCTSLVNLEIANNNIKADVSHIFGNYPNLAYIDLSHNRLYGQLPSNLDGKLTHGFINMTNLRVINLDSNNLVGEVPSEWTNFPS